MNHPTRSLIAAVVAVIAAITCQRKQSSDQPRQSATDKTSPQTASDPVAPDSFRVAFETGKGRFVVLAVRHWAPRGVDRFYNLANARFYDGNKFFRVLPNFMAQFGINGNTAVNNRWQDRAILDDSVTQSNVRGNVSFATSGPNTRTTQLFINTHDNRRLDAMGFSPFARVVEGMSVVDSLYKEYGEGAPDGNGPIQPRIEHEGNAYLNRDFPKLDSIVTARIIKP